MHSVLFFAEYQRQTQYRTNWGREFAYRPRTSEIYDTMLLGPDRAFFMNTPHLLLLVNSLTSQPFVRIHSGNNSKVVFLCICICYATKLMAKTCVCALRPSRNCKERQCLHLLRKINSKIIFVCICICYEMHN